MADDSPSSAGCGAESEIAQFFAGKRVFVTGSTGFMGSVLLEKLLRSCPGLDTIYVLMRVKKGKSLEQRLKEQFDGPLFARLRAERPAFALQVRPLEGDCARPGLGLGGDSLRLLRAVDVVFHAAASVRFNEALRRAAAVNVRATVDLLRLAAGMPGLKAFVYLSTAYSFLQNKVVEEKFYDPALSAEQLLNIVDIMGDDKLDAITAQLVAPWPNTYTFTKAVAEAVVRDLGKGLPVAVVRPSMVISTAREAAPGWTNNAFGPMGMSLAALLGVLRVVPCDRDFVADLVPVDMAINCLVAAAWDAARSEEASRSEDLNCHKPVVLNYVSSEDQPITWGELQSFIACVAETPFARCMWCYDLRLTRNRHVYALQAALLHLLPACIVDAGCCLAGREPFLWDTYKKIHYFIKVMSFFSTHEWRFENKNVHRLWDKMGAADRKEFDFDMGMLRWEQYCKTYVKGLRVYLANDPMDTLPKARAKYARLKLLHYALKGSFAIFYVWGLSKALKLAAHTVRRRTVKLS